MRATNCFREMLVGFSVISTECHKKPLLLSVSDVRFYIGLYKQPRQLCETSAEGTNYVIAF